MSARIDIDGVAEVPEGDEKIYDKYLGFQKVVKEVQNQIEKISQIQFCFIKSIVVSLNVLQWAVACLICSLLGRQVK